MGEGWNKDRLRRVGAAAESGAIKGAKRGVRYGAAWGAGVGTLSESKRPFATMGVTAFQGAGRGGAWGAVIGGAHGAYRGAGGPNHEQIFHSTKNFLGAHNF